MKKEFCPPLDPALFYALISDYDTADPTSLKELRATLSVLKESAVSEDAKTFDHSGTSAQPESSSAGESYERATSWHGFALTEDTELTGSSPCPAQGVEERRSGNVQDGLSALAIHDQTEVPLSPEENLQLLQEMFPTIKAFDREYILKKTGNNFDKAVESLLNQAFLEEEYASTGAAPINRGIEGFAKFDTQSSRRGRKGKGRRTLESRRTSSTPAPETPQSQPSPRSKWDQTKEDVDYLAERIHLPRKSIYSIYHGSGAALAPTLTTLCATPDALTSNPYLQFAPAAVIEAHVTELISDFPTTSPSHAEALVRMTHPSTASAHELAKAMLMYPGSSLASSVIIPQYLPRPRSPPSFIDDYTSTGSPLGVGNAASLSAARANAFTQASAAYRKSKSKPLMGGAAAYYSSVGRDAASALAQHEAAVADALVAGQSTAHEVDLHGVNVKDAVRITRVKVQSWWEGGAAEWARQGKVQGHGGFRVVTGLGRHSAGGKSKLGPAVGAMLVREGWRVEVGDGVVLVRGRVRR